MFDGYRILELGTWVLVPAAATVLADFGADVIKIEHPLRGDPQRGLSTGGVTPNLDGVSIAMEQTNRGKRSVGLDVAIAEGREVLYELAARSDVFMTSFLPAARQKMRIDVEHIRARNPDIIYVRADAVGPRGPDGGKPGYDSAVFFGRAGILDALDPDDVRLPPTLPGFGDKTGAMNIAFGVAAALLKRERTGEPSVVDVSLLGSAMWVNSSSIVYSAAIGADFTRQQRRNTNPIAGTYRTADGRWIGLTMLESDRWWPDLCRHLHREDLLADPRFADAQARTDNSGACVEELAKTFASAPLHEWRRRLATLWAPWEVVQNQLEVLEDPQARENGYVTEVDHPSGRKITVVRAPVQFDETPTPLATAPEPGAHTEEVLLEMGHDWDDIARYQEQGAIA
ncbi:MAG TPA: CoA transferase [Acidimicrobiales bacterium]|jgi:crotonobetainyl-CoA:carnitine CoA-transferase CaiB-like acyl-CoA transferase|nr:CoA transferase [Acidimicrobiales bacterium]